MRMLLVVGLAAVLAVLFPTSASSAQEPAFVDCRNSVVIEGRCVSVDDFGTTCSGTNCVVFVEDSVNICPDGAVVLETDPVLGALQCELTEAASQRPTDCPDGARGEVNDCHVFLAAGPNGCIAPTFYEAPGNCRRFVANAAGTYFCDRPNAQLAALDCVVAVEPVLSPCTAGTTRFDGACWQLNGLTPPESCAGHLGGAIALASGECQVPLAIPAGPDTCVAGATYINHPEFVLYDSSNQVQENGPSTDACVDHSTSIGSVIGYCVFLDDGYAWQYETETECARFELPVAVVCPVGFSIDDFSGGVCRRYEAPVGGTCAVGVLASTPLGTWCEIGTDFAQFECPDDGTVRYTEWPTCVAYRDVQFSLNCSFTGAQLGTYTPPGSTLQYGCFAHVGPQPGVCNGVGSIDDCYEIREPVSIGCATTAGCVRAAPCPVPDVGDFGDVAVGRYYSQPVDWAACVGVTTGTSATTFSPGDTVTRGQLATFLWRYAGEPAGGAHLFGDVPDGQYYSDAVGWMVQEEITTGTTDTTFSPHDPVTRAQLATFLWRFHGEPVGFSHPFTDVASPSYYEDGVAWMAQTGITTGTSDTTYAPLAPLTRAQAVTFLWRYDNQQ